MLNLKLLQSILRLVEYKIGINTPIIFLSVNLHNIYYRYISERYIYGF